MSATVLYMSISLDGFIAGPNDGPGNGLGDGGHRLHEWALAGVDADDNNKGVPELIAGGVNGQVVDEFMATGALVAGRRTFEFAEGWGGDHHDGVPIFVLTHHVDDGDVPPGLARFVNYVETCAREARAAAGESAVVVHGAGAAQALLLSGLMDEMESHLVPVLLGDCRRLFDHLGSDHIELNLVRRLEDRDVTHLRYRVRRPNEAA
jgi:dihydrofolate reductase